MASSVVFGHSNSGFQIGENTGPITANFHTIIEPQEQQPEPLSTVPFPRDPDFIHRGSLVDHIHEKCSGPESVVVLMGLGGVGKSQIAIEYSFRVREESPTTWVFWVHASNAARFEQSFWRIANRTKIPGRQDPASNIFEIVCGWLQDLKERWVMIIDNADDDEFLREWMSKPSTEEDGIIPRPPLLTFIPRCANGSIIWTTRSKRVATNIANARDIIPIEPMDTTQVVALVEKKLTTKQDHDDMIKLAEALEGMPLAIVQATAYIERRAPRCSVKQYLEELQKSDDQKQKLLNLEAGHRQRDWEARNSILATWQISFDHIQKIRPSAADLLSLMSFFDRQGIPEVALQNPPGDLVCLRNFLAKQGIVNHMASVPQDTYNTSLDDASKTQNLCCNDSFEDDITVLREYSFISLTQDLKIFQMHRLVQLATRSWLAAYGEADIWQAHFLWNIQREFRTGDNSRWVKCQSLFPHVKAAMSQRPRLKVAVKKWACLLISGAQYASWSGNTSEMMRMALKANEETERLLGSEHEYSMAAREMLALAYADAGKLREAESLQLGILEIYKRTLGEKHQNYVSHMHSLANTYQRQGRLQDATSLKIRALEIRKNTLGDDDPLTLKLLGSLASTYLDHDLLENAGSLNVQYLEKAKKMLGEEHPDVIAIMENLAITYFRQGRLHDAEILELQTVEACKKVLGESHSHTIRCMSNLAGHRRDRGWLLKAPDRPFVRKTAAFLNRSRFTGIEELQIKVLDLHRKLSEDQNPMTLDYLAALARTYELQCRWKDAIEMQTEVLDASKALLGETHPTTLLRIGGLASMYCGQYRIDEAEALEVTALETATRFLGKKDPKTIRCMSNLAYTWNSLARYEDAMRLMRQTVEIRTEIYGIDHKDTRLYKRVLFVWRSQWVVLCIWRIAVQLLMCSGGLPLVIVLNTVPRFFGMKE